jgi:hypothetical protein
VTTVAACFAWTGHEELCWRVQTHLFIDGRNCLYAWAIEHAGFDYESIGESRMVCIDLRRQAPPVVLQAPSLPVDGDSALQAVVT